MSSNDVIRDDPGVYAVQRDALREFNVILQRDSTDTTYKYALLRALVEISEHQSHHVLNLDDEWVSFPLGLIVEKWLHYYYPFVARNLPQRHGEAPRATSGAQLAFRPSFKVITDYYAKRGGLGAFVRDLGRHGIPAAIEQPFRQLLYELRNTITRYPMKHLGYSWYGAYYQVVSFDRGPRGRLRAGPITRESLITSLGTGCLRRHYFETFRAIGGFATGAEAIFAQWARFTAKANPEEPVSLAEATQALLAGAEDERNVNVAKRLYTEMLASQGRLNCVWTGRPIRTPAALAIDHAIPFSLWGSNALWNLLPATRAANASKSDRIPAPVLVDSRRRQIIDCWDAVRSRFEHAFQSDFRLTLAGMRVDFSRPDWGDAGIESLMNKCAYLIDDRGFAPWNPIGVGDR